MRVRPRLAGLFLAMQLALPGFSTAATFESDYEEKSWAEIEPQLPVAPKGADLQPFYVSPSTENRFYIDRKSLTVGGDGVVRYTLVVVSPSGARNVSYEGIRCETGELRLYAFGHADGTWGKARSNKWTQIEGGVTRNRHHVALFGEYFCPPGAVVGNVKEALAALERGSNPARQ